MLGCLTISDVTVLQSQEIPDRLSVRRELASRFPAPVEPVAPVAPRKPGAALSTTLGLLAGAGAFVGSATPCGKTTLVGEAPLGSALKDRYVAPGEVVPIAANGACTAGAGAGAALATSFLISRIRKGGFVRAQAQYVADQAAYQVARAGWERAVAQRESSLDSAVSAVVADAVQAAEAARARVAAQQAMATAAASPAIKEEVPSVPAPKTGMVNEDAVAVVIGNAQYNREEVPSVDYAVRDAEAMKRFLIETFGFTEDNIIFEENATFTTLQRIFGTREDHKGQLYNYLRPDRPTDVFVFYSGHGAPDPGTGTAYIVPSDADPQTIRLTGYPVRTLYDNLAKIPARSLTVVMDACFSGLADRGSLIKGISPLTLRVENPVLAAENSVVLTASQASEVSGWYDQQQHGLYTYVLLNTFAKMFESGVPAALPSARQLSEQVSGEVLRLSRRIRQRDQTPQVFGAGTDAPLSFIRIP